MTKTNMKPSPAVYPSAAVLVSSGSVDGPKNIVTLAWAANCSAEPPMACIAVRPSRYSHEIISRTGDFVINIPRSTQVKETDYCGQVSGRKRDKFRDCGFTAAPAQKVKAPLIKECPINVECVVRDRVRAGTHDIFIAEIVAVNVDEGALTNGSIDLEKADLIAYGGGRYHKIGPAIGEYGFSTARK